MLRRACQQAVQSLEGTPACWNGFRAFAAESKVNGLPAEVCIVFDTILYVLGRVVRVLSKSW